MLLLHIFQDFYWNYRELNVLANNQNKIKVLYLCGIEAYKLIDNFTS